MKAFHNDPAIKTKYLDRVRAHAAADEIIKGTYWEDGKGCAVGCTIHGSDHFKYETELGIPEWIARVEDTIFEGLPNERAKLWPEQFLSAIKVGSALDKIKIPFIVFILESSLKSLDQVKFDEEKFPEVKTAISQSRSAIEQIIKCHKEGSDLSAARSASESAVWSAASAARSAAYEKFADKLLEFVNDPR